MNASSYQIKFNDCRKPTAIMKYSTEKVCEENEDLIPKEPKPMTVLQKIKNKKIKGYSCQITVTRFSYYCGAYSHAKLATIPEVEVNTPTSTSTCRDMINTKKYISRNQQSHLLEINTEVIIRVVEVGMMEDRNDQVQCKGQPTRIGEEIIDNIVVVSQSKITLMEEDFVLDGANLEVVSDHLILPCKPSQGGCRSMAKTYIWARENIDDCPIRTVQQRMVSEDENYWVDEVNNVVLKKLGPVAAPNGCSNVILHATEYEDIFISEDDTSSSFLPLREEMRLAVYIAARDDFILFEAERKVNRLRKQFQRNLCSQQMGHNEGEIVRIDGKDNFAIRKGETTYVFKCPVATDKVASRDKCYQDIPIGETNGFVIPVTRVYTEHSREIECNKHFPITVRSEQSWLELRPTPVPIADPIPDPLQEEHLQGHHDVSSGGLYTDSEIKSWERNLENNRYHTSILHRITSGVCRNDGRCQQTMITQPGYSLDILTIPTLTWIERLKKAVENYTGLLCLTVLLLEAIKLTTTIVMLGTALISQGVTGLIAVLTMLCCPAQQTLAKIRRRAKRQRTPYDSVHQMETTNEYLG